MTYQPPQSPQQPYQPPQPQYQPYVPPPKPAKRHGQWWKAGWVLGVLGLVLGLIIGLASGGNAKTKTKAVPGPTVHATTTETATATATVTARPTQVIATHTATATVTYTPPPVDQFSDGTYRIGADVPPGLYKTDGQGDGSNLVGCYYAVLNSTDDTDIFANQNFKGPTVATLPAGKYFEVNGGCKWAKVG